MKKSKSPTSNLTQLGHGNNVLFDESAGYCELKLKREVYPLEAVQFAAHHMANEANIIVDMDSEGIISVEMFLKKEGNEHNIRDIYWKFNESVLSYAVYLTQSKKNKVLREMILKKVLSFPVEID